MTLPCTPSPAGTSSATAPSASGRSPWRRSSPTGPFAPPLRSLTLPARRSALTSRPRPSASSTCSWPAGRGSGPNDLPGFVLLHSGPRGPRGGAVNWGSGFLPTIHQGVPFRSGGEPILDLANPPGVNERRQGQALEAIRDLNRLRLESAGDPEIATRISQYEMAYRMQTSAPQLIDLSGETKETLDLYGVDPGKPGFAANCPLARRLHQAGHHRGRDRRVRLRPGRGPAARPRRAGDGAPPLGPGPPEADLPLPGPRLPIDRRRRPGDPQGAGVALLPPLSPPGRGE